MYYCLVVFSCYCCCDWCCVIVTTTNEMLLLHFGCPSWLLLLFLFVVVAVLWDDDSRCCCCRCCCCVSVCECNGNDVAVVVYYNYYAWTRGLVRCTHTCTGLQHCCTLNTTSINLILTISSCNTVQLQEQYSIVQRTVAA